jgi:hypothetical protein
MGIIRVAVEFDNLPRSEPMSVQSKWWWFLFVNDVHVRTYGTRGEALADMDQYIAKNPVDRVRVDRGTFKTIPDGGGYFVNA